MDHNKLFDTVEFSTLAHRGQMRKVTEIPYILHPLRVGQLLIEYGCSEEVVLAGILHDTLEDTSVTEEDLQEKFGDQVTQLVKGASEPEKSAPWEERKQHTLDFLKSAPLEVVWIICADKLDNIRSIQADLERIGSKVWERFNRPREKQSWYYHSMVQILGQRMPEEPAQSMFRQFSKVVDQVFSKDTTLTES